MRLPITTKNSTGRLVAVVATFTLLLGGCSDDDEPEPLFPAIGPLIGEEGANSFRFGAASAATQIEDENPNVDWYAWTAPTPEGRGQGEFVDEAARGYTLAQADIELMVALNLDAYRFSVEWARVEPERDVIDEDALAHYDAFIDALIDNGIRPMITVHHFSNPIWVEDPRNVTCPGGPSDANLCGWDHPEGGALVVEELAEYAKLLAERFGDRVDEWATVNEPVNYAVLAYGLGSFPPGAAGIIGDFDGVFLVALRNLVAGHAAAYQAIKAADTIDADGDGVAAAAGIPKGAIEWVPARDNALSDNPDDIAARERLDRLYHRLFIDAVLQGAFDPDLDGTYDEPHPEWAGTIDWLGVQYYQRAGVTAEPGALPRINVTPCFSGIDIGSCVPLLDPTFEVPAMGYEHFPGGLYLRLVDYAGHYPDLPLVVTESGVATESGVRRAEVVVRALEQIERARSEGVDVRGYYYWSLTDNFEWAEGFGPRFGLYRVDYETYERLPTEAVDVYARIAAARDLTDEVREAYGGDGPLTPEP